MMNDDERREHRAAAADYRRIYPAESDPGALRIELSRTGISSPPDVAIVAIDAGTHGGSEAPVRIVMSAEQAAGLVRRLQAVLAEIVPTTP
jgi:hypothetical protein